MAKQSRSLPQYEELRGHGKITARIIDVESKLKKISGIHAIRMHDEGVHRLFLNDYMPTIGQIIGDVTLLTAEGEIPIEGIRGFYKLQHNVFTLLIEEHDRKEEETV